MEKETMIEIIKAWESFYKLDAIVKLMTGDSGIDFEDFKALWNLPELIKRNSKYSNYYSDKMLEEFLDILNNEDMTAEKKYELLI